jgi:hypothetical protein
MNKALATVLSHGCLSLQPPVKLKIKVNKTRKAICTGTSLMSK